MPLNTISSDRLATNVKNTNFTAAEKQDLTDDIKPLLGSSGGGNKNLVINGAMLVAQRGTSATNSGYGTIDRWISSYGGTDEATTQEQVSVSSGTTPYAAGFRKAFKITNGNQTSGAGAGDYIFLYHTIEAQNIANSGWNYTSATSFITLSFYVKSSVAQNFYCYVRSVDGTAQSYPFETGTLTAGQWTKITKTIPGNSNLQFDGNTDTGFYLILSPFMGTTYTASGVTLNQWAAYSDTTRSPDNTSTWYTTDNATWELTGVQLEVGNVGTEFEHETYGQVLEKCQRYYEIGGTYHTSDTASGALGRTSIHFHTKKRADPTVTLTVTGGQTGVMEFTSVSGFAYRTRGSLVGDSTEFTFTANSEIQ